MLMKLVLKREELRRKLQKKSNEHVAEMQKKEMQKREEQLKEMQEVAKRRRKAVTRSKGVRPSSSSESYESDPEKAYMKRSKGAKKADSTEKPEEAKKADISEKPEEPKEADISEKPKEPEEADIGEKSKEPEGADMPEEGMMLADAVRCSFKLNNLASMLEEDKISKVSGVLLDLENPVSELPEGFGLKLQSMVNEFASWNIDLEEPIRRTDADLVTASDQLAEANDEREKALTLMAEAQMMQATAESKITAAKNGGEKLEECRETVKSVLGYKFRSTEYAEAVPIVLKKPGDEKEKARGSKDPDEEKNEKPDINPRTRGAQFCHPSWDNILRAKPPNEYTWFAKEAAKTALRFIQKDLRHRIGRVDRGIYLRNAPIPTIRCDEGGWVKSDWLLSCELLWTHSEREIGYLLSRTDRADRIRELQRRLQLLVDGNYFQGGDGKIRLQFLGVRLAPSPNPDSVAAGEPPFSQRMVGVETQFRELRREQKNRHTGQDLLMQNGNWIKSWAVRAASGHSQSRSTIMELDPSKFALPASLSFWNQLQGAYHATEYYNLQMIMTEGIKAGRDLMGQRGSSGRLRSYWGVFPPWGSMNKVTCSRSGADQRTPMVTLCIPVVDLIRAGGKVTESGVIMCERTIPFLLVKEIWLCIPDLTRRNVYEQVEKILDYELEDEICTDW
ncbi:unnamed protein product [Symbiodinium sp. KB8]|nr:unnamed protein product [Symbiodinium sp. KB8]